MSYTRQRSQTHMSSRGEMKMSLREMTCVAPQPLARPNHPGTAGFTTNTASQRAGDVRTGAYIFVSEMLEQLQLAIRPLSEYRRAKGLHNLLDGDILVGELVSRRAIWRGRGKSQLACIPNANPRKQREGRQLTTQGQTLPCPRAGGPSTWIKIDQSTPSCFLFFFWFPSRWLWFSPACLP